MAVKAKVVVEGNGTMFSQLFHSKEETVKGQQYAITERKLQRMLQSAYDDAIAKGESLNESILNERSRLSSMNINQIISYKAQIKALDEAKEAIASEYETLFGTPLSE